MGKPVHTLIGGWAILASAAAQSALVPGVQIRGAVESRSKVEAPAELADRFGIRDLAMRQHELRVGTSGWYTLRLHSHIFDAYLIVRGFGNRLVATDDDGWFSTHSELSVVLEAGVTYDVQVCAKRVSNGAYYVELIAGEPTALDPMAARAHLLEDHVAAFEARQAALGPRHLFVGESANAIGEMLAEDGKPDEALPYMEKALAIAEANHGPDHWRTAFACEQVAGQWSSLGQHDKAEPLEARAMRIREAVLGAEDPRLVEVVHRRARNLWRQERFSDALTLFERALVLRESRSGIGSVDAALGEIDVSAQLIGLRRFAEALERLERSRGVLAGKSEVERPALRAMDLTVTALRGLGRNEDANELAELVLRDTREVVGDRSRETATALRSLAEIRRELRRFDEAADYFDRALQLERQVFPEGHVRLARTGMDLGSVLALSDRHDEAVREFRAALAVMRAQSYPTRREIGGALSALAASLGVSQKFAEAEQAYAEALTELAKVLPEDHVEIALALEGRGIVLRQLGRFDEARTECSRALQICEQRFGREHVRSVDCLMQRALIQAESGKLEAAWTDAASALRRAARYWAGRYAIDARELRAVSAQRLHSALDLLLSCGARLGWSQGDGFRQLATCHATASRAAFREVERLIELDDPALRRALEELRLVDQLLVEAAVSVEPLGGGSARRQNARLQRSKTELEARVASTAGLQLRPDGVSVSDLAGRLPAGSVYLDFHVYRPTRFAAWRDGKLQNVSEQAFEPRLLAWVVLPGDERVEPLDLGPMQAIGRFVDRYLAAIRSPRARVDDSIIGERQIAGDALRDALWRPLAGRIAGARRVFVSPAGPLHRLPFEVMRGDGLAGVRYLIEDHEFCYVRDSAWLHDALRPDATAAQVTSRGVLVGGVDYDEAATTRHGPEDAVERVDYGGFWPSMPESKRELRAVRAVFSRAFPRERLPKELKDGDATEIAFQKNVARRSFLHLATHGFCLPVAGVVFAGINDRKRRAPVDDVLVGDEIAELPIQGCGLVTLSGSSCEAEPGELRDGLSLVQAFSAAGVSRVALSLWGGGTPERTRLMRQFYDGIWNRGLAPATALREARLAMLRAERLAGRGSRPDAWGGMVLYGDWR